MGTSGRRVLGVVNSSFLMTGETEGKYHDNGNNGTTPWKDGV